MKRLLILLLALATAWPASLLAQKQQEPPLLAVLMHGTEEALSVRISVLREALRTYGYIEGRNLRIAVRWSDNQPDRLGGLAKELIALNPSVAIGAPMFAVQALHRESKTVPIVIAGGAGAQRVGLIASLARPGGNVTGAINQLEEVAAKQIEIIHGLVPRARRILTLSTGKALVEEETREGTRAAAKVLGINLIEVQAETPEQLGALRARCARERCEALVVLLDPQLISRRKEMVALAARLKLPAVYPNLEFVDDGGLAAYTTDANEMFRRAASFVDRIMKGAKPGDLPVERPTKFQLVVNAKTARAQGIVIPKAMLVRADRVIE